VREEPAGCRELNIVRLPPKVEAAGRRPDDCAPAITSAYPVWQLAASQPVSPRASDRRSTAFGRCKSLSTRWFAWCFASGSELPRSVSRI